MAYGLALHYFPGNSPLHRWDARCKLPALLLITLGLLHAGIKGLVLFSVLFVTALFLSRLPLKRLLHDFKAWGFFLALIFFAKVLFSPGSRIPSLPWLPASQEGIRLGLLTCWSLGLVLGFGILFSAVTRPRELQNAVIWFLTPFPFLPARRIGLMVSLTIRFLPILFDQTEEVRLAFQSRLGNRRKNPFLRAKFLILPVLRRSLIHADEFALALAARGYREDLPLRLPSVPTNHRLGLLIPVGTAIVGFFL